MPQTPNIPPIYRLLDVPEGTNPGVAACARAAEGAEPGTLLWEARSDRLACAVVLAPEDPLQTALQVSSIAMLGLAEALGAVLPPQVEVALAWPNRVLINAAYGGAVRIHMPPGVAPTDVPDWLVAEVEIAIKGPGSDASPIPGLAATTLEFEGCDGPESGEFLASFARHFLSWLDRWQEDGFAPVRAGWRQWVRDYGRDIDLDVAGARVSGRFVELDETGAVILERDGETRRVALHDVVAALASA